MVSPVEALLQECQQRGIRVLTRDGKLRTEAPPGSLTEDIKQQMVVHKAELLAFLAPPPRALLNETARASLAEARQLRQAYAGAVFEMAEILGFPRLPYKPGLSVQCGQGCWRYFVASASAGIPVLRDHVLPRLREMVASIPAPDPLL